MPDGGYITDVEYTGGYYAHQAPALMNYIAALNGYAPVPIDKEFNYCELGCGKGLTTLILAQCYPNGRFWACDFNPNHIREAKALAEEAGLKNVTFLDRSFARMLLEDLPDFEFVTLHGVYSWVPENVRIEIRAFLRNKLKGGGLAVVSYNAMPGWAHIQPIRRMMHAYAAALPGNSIEKARQALAYVKHLADNKANYFATNPAAAEHLKSVGEADIRYVAHEYMTPHGDPFYFPEVQEAMREVGLAFAGSMQPAGNYSVLMVAPRFQQLMNSAPTRSVLETHRDFIANTRFRNDLYAAQPDVPRAPAPALSRLAGMQFCLTGLAERMQMKATGEGLQYDLEPLANSVRAVHELLAKGPADAQAIHGVAARPGEDESATLIHQLVIARHLWPCAPVRPEGGWSKLNSALVGAALRERQARVALAAPQSGGGHYFDLGYAAVIEAAQGSDEPEAAARAVIARLKQYGHSLHKKTASGELANASDEESLMHYSAGVRNLRDPQHVDARMLRQLGIA